MAEVLKVREETLRMAGISLLGLDVALARWRNSNPDLYRYIEGMNPLMP